MTYFLLNNFHRGKSYPIYSHFVHSIKAAPGCQSKKLTKAVEIGIIRMVTIAFCLTGAHYAKENLIGPAVCHAFAALPAAARAGGRFL